MKRFTEVSLDRRRAELFKVQHADGPVTLKYHFVLLKEHEVIERRLVAVCFSLLLLINWIDIRPKGSLKKKNAVFIMS